MVLAGKRGNGAGEAVADAARAALKPALDPARGAEAVCALVRRHLETRFPGSAHWNPMKVNAVGDTVVIDIPGASRAFHDVLITPVFRKRLAIPFRIAKGTSPADWPDAFPVRKKNGNMFLARNAGGQLVALFALVEKAFQKRDPSILPSEEQMAEAYGEEVDRILRK